MSHQLEDDLKVVHLKVTPFFYGFCLMNGTTDDRSLSPAGEIRCCCTKNKQTGIIRKSCVGT